MAAANMPGTRMVTASVKFTSIPWKGSGRCCAPGYARTAAFPRRSCPSIWASFNSSTIPTSAAKPCSAPSLPPWSHDQTATTPQSRKSLADLAEEDGSAMEVRDGVLGVKDTAVGDVFENRGKKMQFLFDYEDAVPVRLWRRSS